MDEKKREYRKEYQRIRRLSPEYREKQRLYMKKRREEPEFRERNKKYKEKWKQKQKEKIAKAKIDELFSKTLVLEKPSHRCCKVPDPDPPMSLSFNIIHA